MSDQYGSNTSHRFADLANEPGILFARIAGYNHEPLASLEEATIRLLGIVPHIKTHVYVVKNRAGNPADGLSVDESAAIGLYTMESNPYTDSVYYILNKTLRTADRDLLKPWFRYLKLLLNALDKLPTVSNMTVYRGVKYELLCDADIYQEGRNLVWWGFSSCSTDRGVAERVHFIGETGQRNLFCIECIEGKNIEKHSYIQPEKEVILLPATHVQVTECEDRKDGLQIIHLKQVRSPFQLLEPVDRRQPAHSAPPEPPRATKSSKKKLLKIVNQCRSEGAAHLTGPIFHESDIEMIVEQLIVKKQCRTLFFREHQLSSRGVQLLSDAVRQNRTLEGLYITDYNLGTHGAKVFAEALSGGNNGTVRLLCLGANRILDGGAIHLANMLVENRTLTHLYLSKNDVGDQGFQRLMEVLSTSNSTLQSLSLEWNQFGNDESLQLAISMLRINNTLSELNLESCKFSKSAVKELRAVGGKKENFKLFISWHWWYFLRGASCLLTTVCIDRRILLRIWNVIILKGSIKGSIYLDPK